LDKLNNELESETESGVGKESRDGNGNVLEVGKEVDKGLVKFNGGE